MTQLLFDLLISETLDVQYTRLCINMFKMCFYLGHDIHTCTAYDIFCTLTKAVFKALSTYDTTLIPNQVNKIANLFSMIIGGYFLPSHLPFHHFGRA